MEKTEMVPHVTSIAGQLYQAHRILGTYRLRFEIPRLIPDSDLEDIIFVYAIPSDWDPNHIAMEALPHIEVLSGTFPPGMIGFDFEVTFHLHADRNNKEPMIEVNQQNIMLSPAFY